ncbi:RVT_3 domain-containing protein, partial [Cephalotus follicularis]
IGFCSSIESKFWGLRNGLHIAIQRGFSKLIILTDAQTAIDLINSTNDLSSRHFYTLIFDYRFLMKQTQYHHLHHTFREANKSTDIFAKIGLDRCGSFCILDIPPACILDQLCIDN